MSVPLAERIVVLIVDWLEEKSLRLLGLDWNGKAASFWKAKKARARYTIKRSILVKTHLSSL